MTTSVDKTAVNVDKTFNASGLFCPEPILRMRKEFESLNSGEILEFIITDPGSINDVPAWCKRTGNELIESVEDNGIYKFYIRKK